MKGVLKISVLEESTPDNLFKIQDNPIFNTAAYPWVRNLYIVEGPQTLYHYDSRKMEMVPNKPNGKKLLFAEFDSAFKGTKPPKPLTMQSNDSTFPKDHRGGMSEDSSVALIWVPQADSRWARIEEEALAHLSDRSYGSLDCFMVDFKTKEAMELWFARNATEDRENNQSLYTAPAYEFYYGPGDKICTLNVQKLYPASHMLQLTNAKWVGITGNKRLRFYTEDPMATTKTLFHCNKAIKGQPARFLKLATDDGNYCSLTGKEPQSLQRAPMAAPLRGARRRRADRWFKIANIHPRLGSEFINQVIKQLAPDTTKARQSEDDGMIALWIPKTAEPMPNLENEQVVVVNRRALVVSIEGSAPHKAVSVVICSSSVGVAQKEQDNEEKESKLAKDLANLQKKAWKPFGTKAVYAKIAGKYYGGPQPKSKVTTHNDSHDRDDVGDEVEMRRKERRQGPRALRQGDEWMDAKSFSSKRPAPNHNAPRKGQQLFPMFQNGNNKASGSNKNNKNHNNINNSSNSNNSDGGSHHV
jgi:hypothetical protein